MGKDGANKDGPEGSNQNDRDSPNIQDLIQGHLTALKELVREHNALGGSILKPIRLDFSEDGDKTPEDNRTKDKSEDDLQKPFKSVLKSPFTQRIVEFSGPKHRMPNNIKLYNGSTDPDDHINLFAGAANQFEWPMPVWCRMFQQTLDGPAQGWFSNQQP